MSPSIRRALFAGSAIVLFLVLAGATYQGVATALERRQFPHPGRLIDVGGHQLHLHCDGRGTPTVVLEAPATAMSSAWAWVQADVARTTRVCSYDRAGLGWSEAGDAPFTPQGVPTELNTLLERAGEHGPYVMAGAELGAGARLDGSVVVGPGARIGAGARVKDSVLLPGTDLPEEALLVGAIAGRAGRLA